MARTKGSDDLFRLIHSLTTEEKGYFKKFAKRHTSEGNKYLQLFDAVNKQEKFEETTLKKKFGAYTDMKGYLFDMIMKCLVIYKNDFPEKQALYRQLLFIDILNEKGLAGKALKLTEAGLANARERELFNLEDEFLRIRYGQLKFSWTPDETEQKQMEFFGDLEQVRRKEANYDCYHKEAMKSFLANRAILYGQKNADAWRKKVDIRFLKKQSTALTPGTERVRLNALITYCSAYADYSKHCDFEGAYRYSLKLFKLEKKWLDTGQPIGRLNSYIYALQALITNCLFLGKIEEMGELLDKEWRVPAVGENQKTENLIFFTYEKSLFFWFSCRHKEGEEFMDKNLPLILSSNHAAYYNNYFFDSLKYKILFEFCNGHYQKAIFSIDSYEAMNFKKNYIKYYKECELMRIVIQAELENFELMQTLIFNILKREQANLSKLEKIFLATLKKMHNGNQDEIFHKLLDVLKSNKEKISLLMLDAEDWLLSAIQKKPIADVMKAKQLKNN